MVNCDSFMSVKCISVDPNHDDDSVDGREIIWMMMMVMLPS